MSLSQRYRPAADDTGDRYRLPEPDGQVEVKPKSGPRRMPGRSVLPGSRAVVGGLLMALAAVVTFLAWSQVGEQVEERYVVAARPIMVGERLDATNLELAAVGVNGSAPGFTDLEAVTGQVARGPVAEGELLQPGLLGEAAGEGALAELSLSLPRDRAVDGRLGGGDRVDIFVTDQDRTQVAATSVPVVTVNEPAGAVGAGGGQVVLTLALDRDVPAQLVHALRVGEVTLVRTVEEAP